MIIPKTMNDTRAGGNFNKIEKQQREQPGENNRFILFSCVTAVCCLWCVLFLCSVFHIFYCFCCVV